MSKLEGKVAVVTWAAMGIGRTTAILMAKEARDTNSSFGSTGGRWRDVSTV